MSFDIPKTLLKHTEYGPLTEKGEMRSYGDDFTLSDSDLTDEMLAEVSKAASAAGEKSLARAMDSILAARAGKFDKSVPTLKAAPEMLLAYFRANLKDGWVYKTGPDGHLHAWLVTDVQYRTSRNEDKPYIQIELVATGYSGSVGSERGGKNKIGKVSEMINLFSESVLRKKVSDILLGMGCYIETDDLRATYDASLAKYEEILAKGFSEQYRFTGVPLRTENWRTSDGERVNRKVIHDVRSDEISAPALFEESALFAEVGGKNVEEAVKGRERKRKGDDHDGYGMGEVPTHFALGVFDLHSHDFLVVNTDDVERYQYDLSLREKIILPEDQRNLLDILTTNLTDFTGDVIEGKSAGNVVLCKGEPGVGKTLTAEVYSELIERPLYSIHSGNLGIQADEVRKNLETCFSRAKRWNAVLLLDEADVFVLERGENLTQNAIVAEFLRTLEYFDGLMFMTTNRAKDIDDAILSRAAAIIDYKIPEVDGIREVWKVQAANHGYEFEEDLLEEVVHGFEYITPRDVKMLLRLSLRVAKGNGVPLDTEVISKCAMFRGLHFRSGARA